MGEKPFYKNTIKPRSCGTASGLKAKKTLVRENEASEKTRALALPSARCKTDTVKLLADKLTAQSLNKPELCSSKIVDSYIRDVENEQVPRLNLQDVRTNEKKIGEKVTKQLNFNMNHRIYKNLIDLNADIKVSHQKKPIKKDSDNPILRKDVEPNLDDFYDDNLCEEDAAIPLVINQPKIKVKNKFSDVKLRELIAKYDS